MRWYLLVLSCNDKRNMLRCARRPMLKACSFISACQIRLWTMVNRQYRWRYRSFTDRTVVTRLMQSNWCANLTAKSIESTWTIDPQYFTIHHSIDFLMVSPSTRLNLLRETDIVVYRCPLPVNLGDIPLRTTAIYASAIPSATVKPARSSARCVSVER